MFLVKQVHARKKPMAEDVDYMAVASMTDGMVGAELANIIEVAAINMMRDGRHEVCCPKAEYYCRSARTPETSY